MTLETVSSARCFGGWQNTYRHHSSACDCDMQFAAYLPPAAEAVPVPALYWLSGLTCTEENFSVKAGAQRIAGELGIALIIPDTSPRGVDIPGEDEFINVGSAAGFYLNATQAPWSAHYRMYDYISDELVAAVNAELPVRADAKIDQRALDGRTRCADDRDPKRSCISLDLSFFADLLDGHFRLGQAGADGLSWRRRVGLVELRCNVRHS